MNVIVKNESGYKSAIEGIGFSYGITDFNHLKKVAYKLCDKNGGHNKFLESIQVWIEITAARYFWAEFDTYRVGTTKQSESTIHTIAKKPITQDDFEHPILSSMISHMNYLIDNYNKAEVKEKKKEWFDLIKANLPEGYLQKRMVCTNYKTLKNMFAQRKNHRLSEWHIFIDSVSRQIQHPELIIGVLN